MTASVDSSLPSMSDLLSVACLAEVARRCRVPRARIWRLRWGSDIDDALIEPLADAMYRDPDFLRAVVENDRARRGAA